MKRLLITIIAVAPLAAHADPLNVGAVASDTNIVTVTTGEEHGLVVGVGFDRVSAVADHPVIVGGDVALSAAGFDLADFRVRAGALTPIVDGAHWKILGGATAVVRGTHDDIARMLDLGVDVTAAAGYYARHWFAAGELGFDAALVTHIAPTDAYRMVVYPDARDGWYRTTGGLLRIGVQGGVSLGHDDVALRAGILRDVEGDPPLFPMYATITYARHW